MFIPEGQVRIFVYGEPVNMRLSYDGLYAKIRNVMGKDPISGHLLAFINRRTADESHVLGSQWLLHLVQAFRRRSID